MGLFSSSSNTDKDTKETLLAWPTPLGVFENYCFHENEVILKLREKRLSLSGDSFEITTADGKGFLKAKPSVMSFNGKNVLTDPTSGQPVLNIQQKPLSLHREFRIFRGDLNEEQLVTVRGKFKLMGATEMTVHFKNKYDGKEVELAVLGDFWERKASISCEGQIVARVDRSFLNSGQLQFDQQTYYLTIAPRVDSAMMAAVCICLDEKVESTK